jgi:hypothetical protein
VSLGTDNGQTACIFHFLVDLDIRTTTCHVGGDGHFSRTTGFSDNFGFPLVLFGVQYVVVDPAD